MDKKDMAPIVIGKLMNIGGMLEKKGNQLFQPFNLNHHQFSILYSIYEEGRVNQKSMVNKLVLEKAHVSKIVKKLHGMDFIEIVPSDDDKRSSWLIITELGKKAIKGCQNSIDKWNDEWTAEIGLEQLESAMESLAFIQDIFRKRSV